MKNVFSLGRLRLLMFFALLVSAATTYGQSWLGATAPGHGYGTATALDAAGNAYLTGRITDTATFGDTTFAGSSETCFLAKLTTAGTYAWAKRLDRVLATTLTADRWGNAYVVGALRGPLVLGADTLTSYGRYGVFIARISAGGPGQDNAQDRALDGSGNVYVTDFFTGLTSTYGTTTLGQPNNGSYAPVFLARFTQAPVLRSFAPAAGAHGTRVTLTGVNLGAVAEIRFGGVAATGLTSTGGTSLTATVPAGAITGPITVTGAYGSATSGPVFRVYGPTGVAPDTLSVSIGSRFVLPSARIRLPLTVDAGPACGGVQGEISWDPTVLRLVAVGALRPGLVIGVPDTIAGHLPLLWTDPAGQPLHGPAQLMVLDFQAHATASAPTLVALVDGPRTALLALDSALTPLALRLIPGIVTPYVVGVSEAVGGPVVGLWPNPAHETVRLAGPLCAAVAVVDALGRTVRTAQLDAAGAATLTVRGLPTGVYVVRIGAVARRLVVE